MYQKLINFFKKIKKKKNFYIPNTDSCKKTQLRGAELNNIFHSDISMYIRKYYPDSTSSLHFTTREQESNDIFEIATVGLGVLILLEKISEKEADIKVDAVVQGSLKVYEDIYETQKKSNMILHIVKYLKDYQNFANGDFSKQLSSSLDTAICFTGAWIIRYYLPHDTMVKFDAASEFGKIIYDNIKDLWQEINL